jgi:hypothetical protein
MLETRQTLSESLSTPTAHQLADYRAIFQMKPTFSYPPRDTEHAPGLTATTDDPWNRKRWRGKLVLNKTTRQLGMVITIAPSATPTADPDQTPIVAFIQPCGTIDLDASRESPLAIIDKIDKCYELPLTQLDLQHSDYLTSPQAQQWQRQANLPTQQVDSDTANTPPTQETPDPTRRKAPPTAAGNLQDRQNDRDTRLGNSSP